LSLILNRGAIHLCSYFNGTVFLEAVSQFLVLIHFLQDVWDDTICPLILGVFHDHVEKCRDIAISVTISIVRNLGEVSSLLR
jgi:hypothetical protein